MDFINNPFILAIVAYNQINTLFNNATTIHDNFSDTGAFNAGPQLFVHFICIGVDRVTASPQPILKKKRL